MHGSGILDTLNSKYPTSNELQYHIFSVYVLWYYETNTALKVQTQSHSKLSYEVHILKYF
jgi:hypothetical protein